MPKSAKIFYRKLRKDLEDIGFVINPYDPCVANKIIDGHQMTITWHVEDLKILHKSEWEITKVIKWLAKIYGDANVKRGKQQEYLGMDYGYRKPGQVRVSTKPYVDKIIQSFPKDIRSQSAMTPAANYIFDVRDERMPRNCQRNKRYSFIMW